MLKEPSQQKPRVKIKVQKSKTAKIPNKLVNAEKLGKVCLYFKAPFDEYKKHPLFTS